MKTIKHFLLTVAALLCSTSMLGVEVEIDGINYDIITKAKQATVVAKSSGEYTGKVVIPESVEYEGVSYAVTSIGDYAFSGCEGLTSVTIPNSVTSIDYAAFKGCSELTDVYCYAEQVPSTKSDAFEGSYVEYATLHVPDASIGDYKAKTPWSGFGTIVALTEEETGIEDIAVEDVNINNAPVYNLQGMKMQNADNLPKGIYIKGGKKFVIK